MHFPSLARDTVSIVRTHVRNSRSALRKVPEVYIFGEWTWGEGIPYVIFA